MSLSVPHVRSSFCNFCFQFLQIKHGELILILTVPPDVGHGSDCDCAPVHATLVTFLQSRNSQYSWRPHARPLRNCVSAFSPSHVVVPDPSSMSFLLASTLVLSARLEVTICPCCSFLLCVSSSSLLIPSLSSFSQCLPRLLRVFFRRSSRISVIRFRILFSTPVSCNN